MTIGHADSANDCSHDSDKTLIGTAKEEVPEVSGTVEFFLGSTIDGTIIVPCVSSDCFWCEDVSIHDMSTKIWHEAN